MTIRYQGKVIFGYKLLTFGIPRVVKDRGGVYELELHPSQERPKLDHVIKRSFVGDKSRSVRLYGDDINKDEDCRASRVAWENTATPGKERG